MKQLAALLPFALLAAGCGGQSNSSEALQQAAEQSTPEAADVLRNAAAQGGNVQEAMQAAGNAQATNGAAASAPPQGAKPHAPGDPVPPPKLAPGESAPPATANRQ